MFSDALDRWFKKYADCLIWIAIAVYCAIFGSLTFLKYNSFNYYDWDFASDITVLWNSVHGHFLYYPFLGQNIFGAHLYLIIFLILPIYAFFQAPFTLLLLQTLFLALAAYPLYLLAKIKISKTAAFFIALAYLLYPSVGFINLFETHFEIYEIFFLFFALYFFEKEKFRNFVIFLVLALVCKENASFVVFMLGFYAFFRKKSARWVVFPMMAGAVWFLLAIKLIIPHFAKDAKLYQEGFMFSVYYKHLGSTIAEMLKTIVLHPVAVARFAFVPEKMVYLFKLFAPVGFLAFFGPLPLLMTIPVFMQNLLSLQLTHYSTQYHYVGLLIPFIFASVIEAFRRALSDAKIRSYRFLIFGFLLASTVTAGIWFKAPQFFIHPYFKAFVQDEDAKAKALLLSMIPPKASVISTFRFLPHLANRNRIYSFHLVSMGHKMYTETKYTPPDDLEYALIDFNDPLTMNSFFPKGAPFNVRGFLADGRWNVLAGAGENILFQKNSVSDFTLNAIIEGPKIENEVHANIGNQMELLGYNIKVESLKNARVLRLETYWKRIGDIDGELGFFVFGLDNNGATIFGALHPLGYRIYPPGEWAKDKVVRENFFLLIPSGVLDGEYALRVGLFTPNNGAIVPVSDISKIDKTGRIILKNILLKR